VTYGELRDEIARSVADGALAPGADLPGLRVLARERGATTATVARALRELAAAGVVETGERRRARVARDGRLAALRLLRGARPFRLAGSDDPALDLLLRAVGDAVTLVAARGSFRGLVALSRGAADGAVLHLRHTSGEYNAPFVAALLRGRRPVLVHLWRREQGIVLPKGNPRGLRRIEDLAGVRVGKREFGTGTRILLDRLARERGVDPDTIAGPELTSHLEVGLSVAAGAVDAGVGVRHLAESLDLDFVPLVWESYDLALQEEELGGAEPLVGELRGGEARDRIAALAGYDLDEAGQLRSLE
jgi:molybdate-binding protein